MAVDHRDMVLCADIFLFHITQPGRVPVIFAHYGNLHYHGAHDAATYSGFRQPGNARNRMGDCFYIIWIFQSSRLEYRRQQSYHMVVLRATVRRSRPPVVER